MKTIFHYIIPLLLIAPLLSGCPGPGPDPEERPFVSLPDEFKSYCYFKEGSYWIYQNDSLASFQDSAYVFSSQCISNFDIDQVGFDFESCKYEMVNANGAWVMNVGPLVTEKSEGPYTFALLEGKSGTTAERAYHFFLDEAGRDTMPRGEEGVIIKSRMDSLEIQGIIYRDVITVLHLQNNYNNPTEEISLAKGVGIVQRKQWDGTIWSLIRHNISQ